jgi:hypothetical protein
LPEWPRCQDQKFIRLETNHPCRCILHHCPDRTTDERLIGSDGEWKKQPWWYYGEPAHPMEFQTQDALVHDHTLTWVWSGR